MKFSSDYAALILSEAASRLVAFVLTAFIARELGLTSLALIGLAQGIIGYATVISDSGLNNHAIRLISAGSSEEDVVRVTSRIQLMISVLVLAPLLLISALIFYDVVWYLIALIAVPIATAASTPYVLQSRGRLLPIATSRIVGAVATLAVGGAVLAFADNAPLIGIAYSAGAIAVAAFIIVRARVKPAWFLGKVSTAPALVFLRATRALTVYTVCVHVLASLPLIFASIGGPSETFEAMGVSMRLWFLASAPAAMLGTVLVPALLVSKRPDRLFRRTLIFLLLTSIAGVFTVWVFGHFLIEFVFGPRAVVYFPDVLILLAALIPFYVASPILLRSIAVGRYGEAMVTMIAAICFYIFFWVMLEALAVPHFASWAWLMSQTSMAFTAGTFWFAGWWRVR